MFGLFWMQGRNKRRCNRCNAPGPRPIWGPAGTTEFFFSFFFFFNRTLEGPLKKILEHSFSKFKLNSHVGALNDSQPTKILVKNLDNKGVKIEGKLGKVPETSSKL